MGLITLLLVFIFGCLWTDALVNIVRARKSKESGLVWLYTKVAMVEVTVSFVVITLCILALKGWMNNLHII